MYGDPHIHGFDGNGKRTADMTNSGTHDYWVVKSSHVHIQIRTFGNKGHTEGIAVGGPFLKGHRLTIMRNGKRRMMVKYDGTEILKNVDTRRVTNDAFEADDGVVTGEKLHPNKLVFRLPLGVELYGRAVGVGSDGEQNIDLKMSAIPGMDGLCGNFDGDDSNDGLKQIQARMSDFKVGEGDSIFLLDYKDLNYREGGLLEVQSASGAEDTPPKSSADCEETNPTLFKQGVEECSKALASAENLIDDCVFDVCATGELNSTVDEYIADLEVERFAEHDTLVNSVV